MMQPAANGGDPSQQQQGPPPPQTHQQPLAQPWMAAQHQQWMAAMQYPPAAAAMAMQQQMLYAQNYMAYQQQQPTQQQMMSQRQPQQLQHPSQSQQQQQQQQSVNGENRTLWIGDLHHWMDETYLHTCFAPTGEVSQVKVIRNKQTAQSEGYGFIEFFSRESAEKVLQSYNGIAMPNVEQPFRLNWATFNAGDRRSDVGSDLSIFVGDLASDVTDKILQDTFANAYSSVKGAKVVMDPNTGRSKGYGFVRFGEESEKSRALTEMNGIYCSTRPMRISVATPKKQPGFQQQYSSQALVLAGGGYAANGDSVNTTIFVGGLDSEVTDEDLRQPFLQFGEVLSVKIPVGKGCGFVQFANRNSAEEAMQGLNGVVIGKQTVRLSWGRNPGNKQTRTDHQGNQWQGGYYPGQGYNGYGYAVVQNQDAGAYATAAAPYRASSNGYGNPQQQVS